MQVYDEVHDKSNGNGLDTNGHSGENGHNHHHYCQHHQHHCNHRTNGGAPNKKPIKVDLEYLNTDLVKENPGILSSDPNVITRIKTTNEEHRKKISGTDLIEKFTGDFKETLLVPGEKPVLTAQSNYQNEYKTKLNENNNESKISTA
jgi:hypothetical protein